MANTTQVNKVLAAMSGGVDSSVAALLLSDAGFDVTGVMMKLYENEDIGEDVLKSCCSLADRGDAETVAQALDIPFYVYNYVEQFREDVMDRFAEEYHAGRTPNPCIDCNRFLKFGALFDRADALGCEYVATGHYARIERAGERFRLMRGIDANKDQSYVLYFLTQSQLARTLLPLGGMTKPDVRAIAAAHGFGNAKKPDSQDICFVPDGDYAAFLAQYSDKTSPPGDFIDRDGHVLGQHTGVSNYTIGQRRGLAVSSSDRLYVTGIDIARNTVTLGANEDLFRRSFTVRDVNIIADDFSSARLDVKIRYSHRAQPAMVSRESDGVVRVTFEEAQRAITPGQAAVFYDGDSVVGGGTITDIDF